MISKNELELSSGLHSGGGESRRKGSREMGFKRDADFDFDKEANFEVVLDLTGDGAD